MDEYQFVKSQMSKDKLTFRGYIYQHQRFWNNNHYFQCEDNNCNGSATLRGVTVFSNMAGSVSEGTAHNHTPLRERVEIVQAVDAIKIRAKATTSVPATIVQEVTQQLTIHNAVDMPSKPAMEQAVHHIRKKEFPVEPKWVTFNYPKQFESPKQGKETSFCSIRRQMIYT